MIKYYCDCCKEEKDRLVKFEFGSHLTGLDSVSGYSDDEGNRVSGRNECLQLCNRCYNQIVSKSIEEFVKIKVKQ